MLTATLAVAQHRTAYRQRDLNILTHRSNIPHYFDRSIYFYEPLYTWLCRSPWRRGRSLAGIVLSNPAGGIDVSFSCECCVLSGRGLCVGLITRPEESYRAWFVTLWSGSLDTEVVLTHHGLMRHEKKPKACVICEVETYLNRLGKHLEKAAPPAKPVICVAVQFVNSTGVSTTFYSKHWKSNENSWQIAVLM